MDQTENTQVEVVERKIAVWTFRRSLEPLATRLEGKVLRASWEHEGYYWGVWEPERLEMVPDSERRPCDANIIHKESEEDYPFFRWAEGAPFVSIVVNPREGSWERRTTPLRETHDVLTVVRPTKFHVPPVIYHTSRHGWECTIIGQVQGRALEFAIMDVAGGGVGWIEDSTSPVHVAEVTRICTRVADQVVDAVVEMSQCTESKVCGLDRKASPDPHFANIGTAGDEVLSLEEVARNCKDAGMDPCDTVLGPGNLSAENIMLDKDGNFVGFSGLLWAGYAPRSWVQLGMIDPSDSSAADLRAYTCALPGPRGVKPGPGDSILLLWQKILSEKLASKGFPKLDAYRLRWLRRQKTVTDDLERTEE